MNDEIKEILEDYSCIPRIKKLGDYITNLQQIEQDHKETNATLMSELAKLEEENERLKENAIHNDKVVDKAKWK